MGVGAWWGSEDQVVSEPVKDKLRRAGLVYTHRGGWVYGNTSRFM